MGRRPLRELTIAGQRVADDSDAFVVAEIGQNHCGQLWLAHHLIEMASQAGCNAVKLQKRGPHFLTPAEAAAPYVGEQSYGTTYGEHRAALELDIEAFRQLRVHADERDLAFGATAFDLEALAFLRQVGVDFVKIASGGLVAQELLMACADGGAPVILSTGGGTLDEVRAADTMLWPAPRAILQCTSLYPCPPDRLNLQVIGRYRDAFPDTVIGFSDHQHGIDMAVAAFVLGARIFEKHITFDHTAKGTDHAFSLESVALQAYVRSLRRVPAALGDGEKHRLPEEAPALVKQGRRELL